MTRELALDGLFQAHEEELHVGIGREEIDAGGNSDLRSVVPTHGVDGDDGFHCGGRNEAALSPSTG